MPIIIISNYAIYSLTLQYLFNLLILQIAYSDLIEFDQFFMFCNNVRFSGK